jgi:glycosyltransferase involved in cell wall biosynthesis
MMATKPVSDPLPALSVVVLSWDGPHLTRRCVEAVRANTRAPYELIIVDNGSAQATQELIEDLADVAVLNGRNLGFAGGMNRGLAVARGQYVAFLNNDAVVPPSWDESLLSHLVAAQRVGMVVPAVTAAANSLTVRSEPGVATQVLEPFRAIPSAVLAVLRTAVIRDLGGWNEDYYPASAEDADLAFTLWVNDLQIVFDERVLVEHDSKGTTRIKLPQWRTIWHENGKRFLEHWADGAREVARLPGPADPLWGCRRKAAAAAAQERLRAIRRQDWLVRRWYRDLVGPGLERWRARDQAVRHARTAAQRQQLAYVTLHSRSPAQGAETHVAGLSAAMEASGWTVKIYRSAPGTFASGSYARRLRAMLRVQLELIARRDTPEVVYVRHHPLSVLVSLWSQIRGIPRIEEVNGTLEDWYSVHHVSRAFRRPFGALSRFNLRTAAGVAAVTPDLAAWADCQGARRAHVIPNGVDPNQFKPEFEDGLVAAPYIVFAGALTPWSGASAAIEATQTAEWPDSVRLVIAGDGSLRQEIEAKAQRSDRVEYLGPLPSKDVPSLLGGALAALSPNERTLEAGSPIKLYEAMAVGRPVIATDVPGQGEIVRDASCGLLVPLGDPVAIAEAAHALEADRELADCLGRSGRQCVLVAHTWRHRADALGQLISDVCSYPPGARRSPHSTSVEG